MLSAECEQCLTFGDAKLFIILRRHNEYLVISLRRLKLKANLRKYRNRTWPKTKSRKATYDM